MMQAERRIHRGAGVDALHFQLEAARRASDCDTMVLADADGLCLAASDDAMPHDEIAAYGAMLGDKVENFEGTLYSSDRHWNVRIRRFETAGSRLFLCAVGGGGEVRATQVHQSVGGVSRILSN